MLTIAQALADDASRIKGDLRVLIGEHSRLSRRPEYDDFVVLNRLGDHDWAKLSVDARRLQTKIWREYTTYRDLVRVLIRGLTGESRREFDKADDLIRQHVEQQNSTWCKTPEEALVKTLAAFDAIADIMERLYSADGVFVMVPDTNALIANPDFGTWTFDQSPCFQIVFTPTVLAELDELKISHRVPEVRTKAESVIRRIKELARRGNLHDGVPVVKDRITARSIAIEPDMAESLPWLDASNNDDRFLASVIEIIRENVRSAVAIVTGDVNLQNKARFARVPFCEPPALRAEVAQE